MALQVDAVEIYPRTAPAIAGISGTAWTAALARITALEAFDAGSRIDALEDVDSSTRWQAQDDADNTSTTSTINYTAAMDYTFTLPTGSWTLTVIGLMKLKHSGSASSHSRLQIAGNIGTAFQFTNLPSATYEMCQCYHQVTGVTGGSKTIRLEYKSNAAGTTSGDNPSVFVRYDKTST